MKAQLHSNALVSFAGEGEQLRLLGDNQTVKLAGSQTGGAFTLIEQNNPPGVAIPPHFHTQEDETFYVLEGEMEFTLGEKKIRATAGTTVFLPRGVTHSFKVMETARALVMTLPSGIENMFRELDALPAEPADVSQVVSICKRYGVHFV
ncbi:MAG TPA: quercetin 2,3-dioxygenase [Candidatus Limnocylindrales bacterium]|jgi:quercetin dioxygenase-like cupin family protein|nr:quercetin 2,3-dioxygenase [Candidatus Limnocylindrales bacterium]